MARLEIVELIAATGGSSQPWRAHGSDGRDYLVKFRGAGPGPDALVAELVVNRVAVSWGAPVPAATPIWLGPDVPRVGTDELWDVLDASAGWNLALAWIPDATAVPLGDPAGLSAPLAAAMTTIDAAFDNYDRTALSGNVLADADGTHWLIDHGSCLFARRLRAPPQLGLAPNHVLAEHAPRIAPLPAVAVAPLIADLPPEWLASVGLEIAEFAAAVEARLDAVRSLALAQ